MEIIATPEQFIRILVSERVPFEFDCLIDSTGETLAVLVKGNLIFQAWHDGKVQHMSAWLVFIGDNSFRTNPMACLHEGELTRARVERFCADLHSLL